MLEVIEDDNWLCEPGEIKVVPLGRPATIDDLRRTKHKAEIGGGEMLVIGPRLAVRGSRLAARRRRVTAGRWRRLVGGD